MWQAAVKAIIDPGRRSERRELYASVHFYAKFRTSPPRGDVWRSLPARSVNSPSN